MRTLYAYIVPSHRVTATQRADTMKNPLDTTPMPVQLKLAAAWTSLMFLVIYVDYYHLYKPGVIENLIDGRIFVLDISSATLTLLLTVIAIPSVMIVLSATLPARANRITNIVVAAVYIPVMVFNAVGETVKWASFYALSIGLELLLLALIIRVAVKWPRVTTA